MSVNVRIPTPLRRFAADQATIPSDGSTVGEVLSKVVTQYPQLREHLFERSGELRNFVNVYVNDEDIRYLSKERTPLRAGDEVIIVPSIAGGATQLPPAGGDGRSTTLSHEEIKRYSRHLVLPDVGVEGQKKLKDSSVLLVGTGGLGSPLALYLAAAGIGHIGLVDFDVVEESNLQRQVIHGTKDVGTPKTESARATIRDINPNITVTLYETRLTSENALDIIRGYDLVADGTDNFATRYLVNDACVLLKKPNVYGSIFRFEGQASVFWAEHGPCYRCLYAQPPPPGLVPSCAEGGVLGILPGVVGLIQATEVVKVLLGIGRPLVGRLLLYDALEMRFRELTLRKNPACVLCGPNPSVTELIDYEEFCGIRPQAEVDESLVAAAALTPVVAGGSDGSAPFAGEPFEISPLRVKAALDGRAPFTLLDVREPFEINICAIDGSLRIPMHQVPGRIDELDRTKPVVVHCRSGARSAQIANYLRQQGFPSVYNLSGGILAWSQMVDPSLPQY